LSLRHYFAKKFEFIVKSASEKKAADVLVNAQQRPVSWASRIATFLRPGSSSKAVATVNNLAGDMEKKAGIIRNLRPDMIRRMDEAPTRINPSGFAVPMKRIPTSQNGVQTTTHTGQLSFAAPLDGDPSHPKLILLTNASGQRYVNCHVDVFVPLDRPLLHAFPDQSSSIIRSWNAIATGIASIMCVVFCVGAVRDSEVMNSSSAEIWYSRVFSTCTWVAEGIYSYSNNRVRT
jgi:hypothetical protein